MKTKLIYLALLISTQISYTQIEPEWVAIYNGVNSLNDIGRAVAVDDYGNIYATGTTRTSASDNDFITIKYGSDGTQIWARTYNGPDNLFDDGVDIAVDSLGNVYVVGDSYSSTTGDDYLTIKYNTDGVIQWTKRYNGPESTSDEAKAIAVDNAGNVYVTGESKGVGTYDDFATIKYDTNGNLLWIKRYNGPSNNNDTPYSMAVDKFGNAYVTGESWDDLTSADIVTIKYSPAGNIDWINRYDGPANDSYDISTEIVVDTSGNVYVVGGTRVSENAYAFATIKYNSSGVEQWVRWWNNNFSGRANSVAVDYNGNVFVTGITTNASSDYATIKYNSDGVLQWEKIYNKGANSFDEPTSVKLDLFGNVYVSGNTGIGSTSDITTIKYNSGGDQLWEHTYNGPGNGEDQAKSMAVDQLGNVYVTGYSTGVGTGWDITTIKYPGIKYPVFIVPGIAGTYAVDTGYDLGWIMTRGINPNLMQVDPLGKVYTDMITTFENLGYEQGKNLFVVNYDWRLTPGPIDNNIDGHIDGLSGVSITSGQFNYGVDYLGWYIKQACEKFRLDYGMELDSIDVIAHSTGGLVTRTYIQSNAYGDVYDISNNYKLPKIRNFIMIGVPNRGASKAWNAIHDNWIADWTYQFVLSKIVNSAYQKVLRDQTITGPDYDITKNDILDSLGNTSKVIFLNKYVPTLRYLLATYDFIDFGSGLTNVNGDIEIRNTIVLDLNN